MQVIIFGPNPIEITFKMKIFFCSILLFSAFLTKAQVGIGTTNPQATLDVREVNPATPNAAAGIAIPQVTVLPSSGNRAGQLIYLTTTNLYYFYDGSSWNSLITQVSTVGDVKYGYQSVDHTGWILLNGRLKSTLTASQQAKATLLGIGANLPNIADKSIVGVSGTKALNTSNGNASVTINQNQLPNVTLTTSNDGAHTHNSGVSTGYFLLTGSTSILNAASDTANTSTSGSHSHTTSSINGNVTQQSLNIQNPYLALNGFIYLGM
ncbi:hypothetical protein [Flavobacterium sp.]|uniref:hypothetical protein n=1 Tax=Flavobacterium sp. TaxID=239 RepID=UPI00261D5DD2|nr:hypothetical protein [Flavobacterium sp.]